MPTISKIDLEIYHCSLLDLMSLFNYASNEGSFLVSQLTNFLNSILQHKKVNYQLRNNWNRKVVL